MSQSVSDRDRVDESAEKAVDDSEVRLRESRAKESQREAAQGVEVFEDPDATIPRSDLRQGAPGHESLVGDDSTDEDEPRATGFEDGS